jgi:uncharacterized OB-fold protein
MTEAIELPPQPRPDPDSEGFWKHIEHGHYSLQRCQSCRQWQFPNLERCRKCGGELQLEPVSGEGTIHTFIVEHHKVAPGFDDLRPYAIALVCPDEAPHVRIPGRIIGADPSEVSIGARVQAEVLDHRGGDFRILGFRLVPGDGNT